MQKRSIPLTPGRRSTKRHSLQSPSSLPLVRRHAGHRAGSLVQCDNRTQKKVLRHLILERLLPLQSHGANLVQFFLSFSAIGDLSQPQISKCLPRWRAIDT
jgi:hypothetical protein